MFDPGPPVFGRLVQEFVADLDDVIFNPKPPGQCEVHLRGERDKRFLAEIREGHVGKQT